MTAHYGARAPLALSRLTYDRQKQEIAYTYTNPYDRAEYTEKVTPHELIARFMIHVPDPGGTYDLPLWILGKPHVREEEVRS